MPLGMDIGLGPGDFVFGGDPAPPPRKEGTAPTQFLTPLSHVYCGQTTGWIKIPLGTEVNLGLGDVVLDGGRSSPLKGAQPASLRPMSIVAKRLDGFRRHLVKK